MTFDPKIVPFTPNPGAPGVDRWHEERNAPGNAPANSPSAPANAPGHNGGQADRK